MKQNKLAPLRPLFLLFIAFTALFIAGKNWLAKWSINQDVVIIGNLLMLLITLVSYLILLRGLKSANPHAFVRAVYGSFIIKFFVIAITAFVYIMIAQKNVSKGALIVSMVIYLIYTFIEVSVLTKLLKQKKNA
jgi:ACR3 family arsenite efflux pump ArsB